MPEISDEEYRQLNAARALMDRLHRDPKTKRKHEANIKTLFPETVTTEDLDKPITDEIKAVREELHELRKNLTEKEVDGSLAREFDHLRAKQGFTQEGLEDVKKIMLERNIASPLDAGKIWLQDHPPAPPPVSSMLPQNSWGFTPDKASQDDHKELFKDEDRWAEREAMKVLDEARRGILTG